MTIKLRDYQNEYIEGIRSEFQKNSRRVVLCAPTGSGKTYLFSYMIANALERGNNCLVFTHRKELLMQASGAFSKFNIAPQEIKSGHYPDLRHNIHVAMEGTFYRRITTRPKYLEFLNTRDLIVIDEAHFSHFDKILDQISNKKIFLIGATATPYRKGKNVNSLDKYYQSMVSRYDTPDLIENGYLVPAVSYGIEIDMKGIRQSGSDYQMQNYYESNKTYEGVVDNYKRLAENEKTILFASNVKSSKQVCAEFISRGYNARHVDGTTPEKERNEMFEWFDKTDNAILCNCGIATTGFDQPDIKCVILYRATTSLPLFMQMCGRGSRLSEGKTHFKLLDFGNNIQRHGFWEAPREWSLKKRESKNKEQAAPIKICQACEAINYASAKVCVVCGSPFPKPKKSEEVVLKELKQKVTPQQIRRELREGVTFDRLEQIKDANGYKQGWVWNQIPDTHLVKYSIYKGYKSGWVFNQKMNANRRNDVKILD